MKKILAYVLILSTLISCGSVCFAGRGIGVLDDDSDVEIDYSPSKDEPGDDCDTAENIDTTKRPKKTPENKERSKPKKSAEQLEKENLIYFRNQAMFLLHDYYEDGYIGYINKEISEMKIGDLNEDCTILTVNGESQILPVCVVETLIKYLAKRAEVAPDTMDADKPLFIGCKGIGQIKQGLPTSVFGVFNAILQYRKTNSPNEEMEEQ